MAIPLVRLVGGAMAQDESPHLPHCTPFPLSAASKSPCPGEISGGAA
jgi:hypothetical protein